VRPALSPSKRARAAVIAAAVTPLIDGLGGTYSWIESGLHHIDEVRREGRQPIFALWHGRILSGLLWMRDRGIVVITSENFDGEWIARVLPRFGYGTARGSSSRGGAKALVRLRRDLRDGHPVAFTIDGPRGPAGVAQPGAVWLAGATGNPILPLHVEADRHWTVSSWDQHQVPRPGGVLAAALGPPIEVPAHTDAAALEAARVELEGAMTRLREQTLDMLHRHGRE
jgi:lysophospholipid acyltransferase (LPLAT)-like uncharacterized protein